MERPMCELLINENLDSKCFKSVKGFNPISFINYMSDSKNQKKADLGVTMINDFPIDWVKKKDISTLMSMLDSKNPYSSYIPQDEYAEKGGYARVLLQPIKSIKG